MTKISGKRFLLDVSLLVALADKMHVHHQRARSWFQPRHEYGFSTSPLTQLGCLRTLTNSAASSTPASIAEARELLELIISSSEHEFWPDDRSALEIDIAPLRGHNQWNDAYLLALARKHGGVVATFDKGMLTLAGKDHHLVELIR